MRNTKAKFPLSSITMRKNNKYISDVKNKIVEHHKLESGCKKRARAVKIPIPTIRAIIKSSNQLKIVQICLEEDVCLYRPNARSEGEFEWLKTLQGPQLENCRD